MIDGSGDWWIVEHAGVSDESCTEWPKPPDEAEEYMNSMEEYS